jgi:neopullulanase
VHRVANPNYLFVTLDIAADAKPEQVKILLRDKDKIVLSMQWPVLARVKNSAQRQGFNSSDAIYLITPDRFANGNKRNDAVAGLLEQPNRANKGGRHGGDIAGMEQHLNYIAHGIHANLAQPTH